MDGRPLMRKLRDLADEMAMNSKLKKLEKSDSKQSVDA